MPHSSLSNRVVKAMSVFGGVQVVGILCSVIRTKLVSIWIGAAGVGLIGIFNSAIDLLTTVSLMGVSSSGVRDVAANAADPGRRRRTVTIVRRWSRWLGVIGAVATFLLAPLLSRLSFGSADQTLAFRLLSVCIIFTCLNQGQMAVLEGLSRLKKVARATLVGTVVGLAISIPLFYFYRIDSIVPVLIASSGSALLGSWLNREKEIKNDRTLSYRDTVRGGESLIRLGFFITLSTVATLLASYVLLSYFTAHYGEETAGFFQAGFTLINRYVGLVFSAIALEYYPRLSGANGRRLMTEVFVSHEMKIALAVLIPFIGLFIVCSPLVISILYSSDFSAIEPFIEIGITGTLFRAVSWCMSFTILAKGDGRIFLITEVLSATAYVLINIVAMNLYGVDGLGYAYLVWYMLYTVIVGAVYRYRYHYRLRRGMVWLIVYALLMTAAILLTTLLVGRLWGLIPLAFSIGVSLRILLARR